MEFQKYFQSYQDYFWQWEKEEDSQYVITTSQGVSVAYEGFVFEVLESLSLGSTPPFGSLVLAIMATNNNPGAFLGYIESFLNNNEDSSPLANKSTFSNYKAIDFLKTLSQLPDEYKSGVKRREIFFTVFKNSHNSISSSNAKSMIEFYKNTSKSIELCYDKKPFSRGNFLVDIRTLALLNDKFPTTKSILDGVLGIPVEEIKEDIQNKIEELPIVDKPFDFVENLINNDKTFHIGSLIKRLWSGLKINMRHKSPSEQPLGGVSDITNKGDVNRLLLSEFANDDEVFMQRIANNEALYILREVPPESNKLDRIILLDSSIKSWGNVRTINYAIALAIAKHPKTDFFAQIFALTYKANEVFYNNIHEIIDGLEILSPFINCNDGIENYIDNNYQNNQELFFITTYEQLRQIEVQTVLKKHQDKISYVIYTNENGEIKIFKQLKKGKKHIQDLKLNLEELWTKKIKSLKPLQSKQNNGEYDGEVPILYPSQKNYTILECEGEYYKINAINTLYKFHNNSIDKGFEKITYLPAYNYNTSILYKNEYNEMVLICYDYYENKLIFNNINTEKITEQEFPISENFYFQFHNNCPYVIYNDQRCYKLSESKIEKINFKIEFKTNFELNDFIKRYKRKGKSYNIFNKFTENVKIFYDNNFLINQYYINNFNTFQLNYDRKIIRLSNSENFKMISDLVLKRIGNSKTKTIHSLIDVLGISLKEAKEIVDEGSKLEFYNKTLLTNKNQEELERYKTIIENSGSICYIVPKYCESEDGSQIHLNDGILKFISSDTSIPVFYIPFITGSPTILATNEEFTGDTYFLPENNTLKYLDVEAFRLKYLQPFINTVINYANKVNT